MRDDFTLWAAVLASPAIWFASLEAGFAVAPLTCARHSPALLWLISVIAAELVVVSGLVAWQKWQRGRGWLALNGMILSAGFLVMIAAQAIPGLMLAGCE